MTEEEIRRLDGPSLCRLAFEMDLAPQAFRPSWAGDNDQGQRWHPHEDLPQADAVVRQLRARGWLTRVEGFATYGNVSAVQASHVIDAYWGKRHDPTEAMALLRVSVLAVCAQQRAEETP